MSAEKILIVEDEKNLGTTLREYLGSLNYTCYLCSNVSLAKEIFDNEIPQIVLMDIGLPDGNGIELARELREKRKDFILLFLSAQNDPETKVKGLEVGAEDYITKPFALKELTLRLKKILNFHRDYIQLSPEIKLNDLFIRFQSYEVIKASGEILPLTQKECEILKILYKSFDRVVSREKILERVWGEESYPTNRTVDNYVVKLRRWAESSKQGVQILSIRGVGYKLTINKGQS